jgi:hypothetical protein
MVVGRNSALPLWSLAGSRANRVNPDYSKHWSQGCRSGCPRRWLDDERRIEEDELLDLDSVLDRLTAEVMRADDLGRCLVFGGFICEPGGKITKGICTCCPRGW